MRILSQDGLHERTTVIDVPYEQVSIEQKGKEIWCGYYPTLDQHCIAKMFAEYSTEDKAKRAMKMLHEKYLGHVYGKGGMMATDNFYVQPFAFIPPKIFQFPTDDELED